MSSVLLDSDHSLALSQVLHVFGAALNEEQCWAVCHQTLLLFRKDFSQESCLLTDPEFLFLVKDGSIHPKSLTIDPQNREKATTKNKLLSSLGVLLFKSLDFGYNEDEEPSLSPLLETLIHSLTSQDSDEGIERDLIVDPFDDVIHKCCDRFASRDSAEAHYRAVVRALVAETLELSQFLDQVHKGKDEIISDSEVNDLNPSRVHNWARLWVQVIRELRDGVKLRKVDLGHPIPPLEYELTPFEMLLDDIRLKRYKLRHVNQDSAKAKKDAHDLILDFIRSRPPLTPASRRELRPPPQKHVTLYEKLMQSIRANDLKLKPISQEFHSSTQSLKMPSSSQPSPPIRPELTPAPKRRLIKADLKLSFDESEAETEDLKESQEKRFSLKNLSLKLLERRHSINVCESPSEEVNPLEDTRQHVADIWQSTDWGHALHTLSLTLQEVQHIRSVLTKAEIETLAVTRELRQDLESGKICFTCLKTRFSFFGARPNTCKVCERAICDRCATRMHIPCETFEKVPIYMLSPSPSPPEERAFSESIPQMKKKSSLMRLMTRDSVLVDSGLKGPLVRVCRDCKILVRHLVDMGTVS